MGISKVAILALRGLDQAARIRLANGAGVHLSTLNRWIATNHDNLTKAATLDMIKKEIGLEGSEILKTETEGAQS